MKFKRIIPDCAWKKACGIRYEAIKWIKRRTGRDNKQAFTHLGEVHKWINRIFSILGNYLLLASKYYLEIKEHSIEYSCSYKMCFSNESNDGVTKHLNNNILKSSDTIVLTRTWILRFTRKTQDYKLTYAFLLSFQQSLKGLPQQKYELTLSQISSKHIEY